MSDTMIKPRAPLTGGKAVLFRILAIAGAAALVTFPLWSFFFSEYCGISGAACALIASAFLLILYKPIPLTAFISMATALLGILAALSQNPIFLRAVPVAAIALAILALYLGIGKDDAMVTRSVADNKPADNPVRAYSKALSWIWIVFLFAVGAVAVLTSFWGNMRSWAFWNGGMIWVLILLFSITERLTRGFFLADLRKQEAKNRSFRGE